MVDSSDEREDDYMINPKHIDTRFMAIGCDSTDLAKEHLPAGLHPFDKSARPQVVHQKDNPGYHALIKAFEDLTQEFGLKTIHHRFCQVLSNQFL